MNMNQCKWCSKSIRKNGKYCNQKCMIALRQKEKIQAWLNNRISGTKKGSRIIALVRSYILEKNNFACSKCGWDKKNPITNKSPLEINHIDGNSENNRPENLEVLCPNCHSLTPTWKALNKGNGNKERLRYSGLIGRL